jgi:transposase InsO family protein
MIYHRFGAAALKLNRGEDLELISRELGVTAATLSGWRDDFQDELAFLGMTSSPSFVREPEGNGCAGRFVRTLKENLLWIHGFETVAELIEALREFKRLFNEQWLVERHGFRTPNQARSDFAVASRGLDSRPRCRNVG